MVPPLSGSAGLFLRTGTGNLRPSSSPSSGSWMLVHAPPGQRDLQRPRAPQAPQTWRRKRTLGPSVASREGPTGLEDKGRRGRLSPNAGSPDAGRQGTDSPRSLQERRQPRRHLEVCPLGLPTSGTLRSHIRMTVSHRAGAHLSQQRVESREPGVPHSGVSGRPRASGNQGRGFLTSL